jgi:hypothetical protein
MDASVAASGPHVFAVRNPRRSSSNTYRVHCSPPNVRDDGRRPSDQDGMPRNMPLICHSAKAKYFLFWGLTLTSVKQKGFARLPSLCDMAHIAPGQSSPWCGLQLATCRETALMTGQHNGGPSHNEMCGTISDTELDHVTGGDKATTTTKDTTKTTTPTKPIVFTLEQVLVSSY